MKKIKVIQIGTNHDHADKVMASLRNLNDLFDLVGCVVLDDEPIPVKPVNCNHNIYDGVPVLTLDEALGIPDLDAAVIETSEINLTKYATLFAERGVAVHMDKPGGLELSDFEALIETVKKKGVVFHTGYMYRYNPAVIKLMQDIQNGKLGEIYSVETHMDCLQPVEKRNWLSSFKGGEMFFLGCHLIDLIYRIMGEPQEVVPFNCSTGIDGVTAIDYGMAVLKYKNGVSFAKACATEHGGFARRHFVVCGSKGTVQLMPFELAVDGNVFYTKVREVFGGEDWNYRGEKYSTEDFDRYDPMMKAFASYVSGEKTNPYTYDYELNLYKLILKCCE